MANRLFSFCVLVLFVLFLLQQLWNGSCQFSANSMVPNKVPTPGEYVHFSQQFDNSMNSINIKARHQNIIKRECPPLNISPEGSWSVEEQSLTVTDWQRGTKYQPAWKWTQASGSSYSSSAQQSLLPNVTSLFRDHNVSLVFYGSSHVREIYIDLVRLAQGVVMGATLPKSVTYLPSGTKYQDEACDPQRRGWISGLLGVDMAKCGFPGRRMVPELGSNKVAIGFKTFLHTPEAEAHFLDFLSRHEMRHPSTLVVDVGIWGVRGQKVGGWVDYELSAFQELDYYLKWLQASFHDDTCVVIVYERLQWAGKQEVDVLAALIELADSSPRYFLLRKDHLLDKKPKKMACKHGCAGPVVRTVTLMLVEWMRLALTFENCL